VLPTQRQIIGQFILKQASFKET